MTMGRAFCLTVLATLFAAAVPAGAQDRPLKIAIANPARVFSDIQETKDLRGKMENLRKGLAAEDQQRKAELNDLQTQRQQLKPDSPQYAEKNKELLQKAIEYETWGKMQQANMQHEQKLQMKTLFDKIEVAVAEIAKQRQIDIVIAEQKPDFPDDIDAINVDQLRMLINQRNVLYAAPEQDISNEVIALLDARYRESGK